MALILDTVADAGIVHLVQKVWSRGYNGTDYYTVCAQEVTTSEKWPKPQCGVPTCIACLGAGRP